MSHPLPDVYQAGREDVPAPRVEPIDWGPWYALELASDTQDEEETARRSHA